MVFDPFTTRMPRIISRPVSPQGFQKLASCVSRVLARRVTCVSLLVIGCVRLWVRVCCACLVLWTRPVARGYRSSLAKLGGPTTNLPWKVTGTARQHTSFSMAASPFLGLWTYASMDEEQYHHVLGQQGLPWAVRKLLQQFTAQREFCFDADGFLFRSKMLTGSWNELRVDTPTVFSVLGYTVDTLITWEENASVLVSTMKTTAADGYFTSGWSATTRIAHAICAGELVVTTITPEGEYRMTMTRQQDAPA